MKKAKWGLAILIAGIVLWSGILYAVYGPNSDTLNTKVEFTHFADNYYIGTSGEYGWRIISASLSGGSRWSFICGCEEGNHSVCGNSTSAVGRRSLPGGDSIELFSASIYGTIVPPGGDGPYRVYSYSVTGVFKGVLSVTPTTQTAPLWGGVPESFRLLSTYDGVPHHIGGYWRTLPNKDADTNWHGHYSYYGGDTRWPGSLQVQAAAHSDGGDQSASNAVLRVVGVSSITASGRESSSIASSTDGWKRDGNQDQILNDEGQAISEAVPTLYVKQAQAVSLVATPTGPGAPWPVYSTDPPRSYPVWGIDYASPLEDYLTVIFGASSSIKAEKGFGQLKVNAGSGNHKSLYVKYIRVKFAKKNIYAGWNIHDQHDVTQYLAGKSSLMGCADPSSCTDLECNHRGVNDESQFSWSVTGDAELVLTQNNTTIFETSFSPGEQKDKPAEQKRYFTGRIRFTKPSLTTQNNITVVATSEELSSETDTLSIIPQYIDLQIGGADEEEYIFDENGNAKLSNPRTAESSAGVFVPVNDNDNNQDRNVDRMKDTETLVADPDILEVIVAKKMDGIIDQAHPITLSLSHVNGYASSIKVWKDAARSELFIDGHGSKTFTSETELPASIFVEAVGSTSANLSISYSYSVNTDYSTTTWHAVSVSDSLRLEGFNLDLAVDGVTNESAVTDQNGNAVRTLASEEFPGGEIDVAPISGWTTLKLEEGEQPKNLYLVPVTLSGNNLIRNATNMQLADGEPHPDLENDVLFTCASDKVEFYERLRNPDNSWQIDDLGNPIYRKLSDITQKVKDLPRTIYLRPVKDSDAKRDVELKVSYISPQNAATHEDAIKLTLLHLDVDVDSNDDGTVAVDDETEDTTELYAPIEINSDDKDSDNIPDNVDYQIVSSGFSENIFKELIITLPQSIDLDNCKIKIDYGAATPPLAEGGTLYADGTHSLRLWKKQSNEIRNPNPLGGENQTGTVGGDFVMPTNWPVQQDEDAYYTPSQLLGAGNRQGSLWAESVCEAANYNARITVFIVPITARNINAATVIPDDEATVPENYNLSDTVGFSTIGITLEFPNPIPAELLAGTTAASRGYDTILVTNIADESADGKRPDYANFEGRSGESSLLQLDMTVKTGNIPKNSLKIKFEYDGPSDFTGVTESLIDDGKLKDIFMRGSKQYYDYTPFKKGKLRVWASSRPVQDAGGGWSSEKVITASSARDRIIYANGGNYFAPASAENAYTLSDLFPDSSGPNYSMSFQVEGINPNEKAPIKAILLYDNGSGWQEVAAAFVNIKVLESKVILNVNNDKDHELDDEDHKIKDQHDGFQGWFASVFNSATTSDATSTHGLENLFSVLAKLPKLPDTRMGYIVYCGSSHNGILIEKPDGSERLNYLISDFKDEILDKISNPTGNPSFTASSHPVLVNQDAERELLLGTYDDTTSPVLIRVALVTDIANPITSQNVVLDSGLATLRPVDKYFMFGSCRSRATTSWDYPIDGTDPTTGNSYTETITPYDDVTFDTSNFATRDTNFEKYFVFLHGYNVNLSAAQEWNRVIFRRMYWSGYRGNHLGITWHGNEGQIPGFDSPLFWTNTHNALHSSRALSNLMYTARNTWGASSSDVSIMAHSLGNAVMWDALRVYSASHSGQAVKTAVSAQGAVWEEAFFAQTSITCTGPDPADTITYSVQELITHSWAFWFRQAGKSAGSAVGTAYNSYNSADEALDMMILSDYILKDSSIDFPANWGDNHYDRADVTAISPTNRTSGKLANYIPALLWNRIPGSIVPTQGYKTTDLNRPIGLSNNINMIGLSGVNAGTYGWRTVKSDEPHSDLKNLPLYTIYPWYEHVQNKVQ